MPSLHLHFMTFLGVKNIASSFWNITEWVSRSKLGRALTKMKTYRTLRAQFSWSWWSHFPTSRQLLLHFRFQSQGNPPTPPSTHPSPTTLARAGRSHQTSSHAPHIAIQYAPGSRNTIFATLSAWLYVCMLLCACACVCSYLSASACWHVHAGAIVCLFVCLVGYLFVCFCAHNSPSD